MLSSAASNCDDWPPPPMGFMSRALSDTGGWDEVTTGGTPSHPPQEQQPNGLLVKFYKKCVAEQFLIAVRCDEICSNEDTVPPVLGMIISEYCCKTPRFAIQVVNHGAFDTCKDPTIPTISSSAWLIELEMLRTHLSQSAQDQITPMVGSLTVLYICSPGINHLGTESIVLRHMQMVQTFRSVRLRGADYGNTLLVKMVDIHEGPTQSGNVDICVAQRTPEEVLNLLPPSIRTLIPHNPEEKDSTDDSIRLTKVCSIEYMDGTHTISPFENNPNWRRITYNTWQHVALSAIAYVVLFNSVGAPVYVVVSLTLSNGTRLEVSIFAGHLCGLVNIATRTAMNIALSASESKTVDPILDANPNEVAATVTQIMKTLSDTTSQEETRERLQLGLRALTDRLSSDQAMCIE